MQTLPGLAYCLHGFKPRRSGDMPHRTHKPGCSQNPFHSRRGSAAYNTLGNKGSGCSAPSSAGGDCLCAVAPSSNAGLLLDGMPCWQAFLPTVSSSRIQTNISV